MTEIGETETFVWNKKFAVVSEDLGAKCRGFT